MQTTAALTSLGLCILVFVLIHTFAPRNNIKYNPQWDHGFFSIIINAGLAAPYLWLLGIGIAAGWYSDLFITEMIFKVRYYEGLVQYAVKAVSIVLYVKTVFRGAKFLFYLTLAWFVLSIAGSFLYAVFFYMYEK